LNEDESIESLTESCKSYIDHQERSRKLETVKVLVKASTKLQECFPVKSDLLLFCETVQFQLLLNSSPKFHGYLNGKDVPLYDIVQETVSCCEAAIRNQVSPEGILVLLHELGWN
jgi:hypothetical protein